VFYRNFVPKTSIAQLQSTSVFEIIDFKNAVTLKFQVRGPSRSLETSPFDRAHTTAY